MRANQLVINSSPVEQIPFEDYINPMAGDTNYGWVIYGNYVKINPIPTTTTPGTFYYFRSEPALSSDGATPILPPVYHYIVVCYGAYLCAARRQDESRASLYLQEYGNWLRTMNDDNRATIKKRIKFDRLSDYASWD